MNAAEVVAFMKANPACHLATVEGDQPRVRGMFLYRVDEHGVLFHTGALKPVWSQIRANPRVELCFNNPETNAQIRVEGLAEPLDDGALKEEIVRDRPFLKPVVEAFGLQALCVFRVKPLRASQWSMATNSKPSQWIPMA